jgi:hypothetical protein
MNEVKLNISYRCSYRFTNQTKQGNDGQGRLGILIEIYCKMIETGNKN